MVTNARIADLIRENKPDEITDAIAEGEFFEMQTFAAGADRPRARGRRRPRGRRERGHRTATTSSSRSSTPRRRRPPASTTNAAAPASADDQRAGAVEPEPEPEFALRLAPLGEMMRLLVSRSSRSPPPVLHRDTPTCTPSRTPPPSRRPSRSRRSRRCTPPGGELGSAAAPNTPDVRPELLGAPAQPQQLTYDQLLAIWQGSRRRPTAIPWQVLAAINKVESNFGRNMGPSSAGAIGWMQFMPDTWARWGVDANGDGIADPWNARGRDLLAPPATSPRPAARPTSRAQSSPTTMRSGTSTRCCSSRSSTAGGGATFATALDAAQQRSTRRSRRSLDANAEARMPNGRCRVARRSSPTGCSARANRTPLVLPTSSGRTEARRARRDARAATSRLVLDARRADLADGRDRARRRARDQLSGGRRSRRAPRRCSARRRYSDGYVFPVGGGAGVVSVGHTHHDYPAADIAAPEGTQSTRSRKAIVENVVGRAGPRTAASASRSRRPTASRGRTATSRTSSRPSSRARRSSPASRSGSSARRATRPARTSTSSSSPRPRIRRTRLGSSPSRAPPSHGPTAFRRMPPRAWSSPCSVTPPRALARSTARAPPGQRSSSPPRGLESWPRSAERESDGTFRLIRAAPGRAHDRLAPRHRGADVCCSQAGRDGPRAADADQVDAGGCSSRSRPAARGPGRAPPGRSSSRRARSATPALHSACRAP